MDKMTLEPGMVVMAYNDCGENTIQAGQLRLLQRLRFEPAEGYPDDQFGYWIVRWLRDDEEGLIPLSNASWIIDEYAPPAVMFAAPHNFDPSELLVYEEE